MVPVTLEAQGRSPVLRVEIRALREAKKLTQGELATRAGVTRATVNRIEKGHPRSIDLDVLEKLAKALDVAPAALLRQSEDEKPRGGRKG